MAFIFGGNTGMTYEQMRRAREFAQQTRADLDRNTPRNWGEGVGALMKAFAAQRVGARADKAAEEGRGRVQSAIGELMAGRYGGQAPQPTPQQGVPDAGQDGAFPASLVQSESGGNWGALNDEGYGGRLQFGADRLADAARAGVIPAGMTGAQFSQLAPQQQQAVERWHFADIDNQAQRMGLDQYLGQNVSGIPITQDGIRAMAHLGGIGGAAKFLQSGGQYNPADSNGTSLADYARKHGGGGQAGVAQGGAPQGQGIDPRLMQIMSDPYVAELAPAQQSILGALVQQQIAQAYPEQMTPYQQAQIDLSRQQFEFEREQAAQPKRQPLVRAGDGTLYDPNTGEWLQAPQGPQGGFDPDRYRVVGNQLYDLAADGGPKSVGAAEGQVETVYGPDGNPIIVRGTGANARPFTEGQSKDVVFSTRARGALEALEPASESLTSRADRALGAVPFGLGRGVQGSNFQVAENAGNEFLQAILRKDTGAAITTQEHQLYGKTYLPQPGDGPQVLEQKRQARSRAVAAIEAGMSPAQMLAQERGLQASGSAPRNADAPPPVARRRRRWTPDGGLQ